jgi:hypothetical protein
VSAVQIGVVMLVHEQLNRAVSLVNHWCAQGCPVAIHVDRRVPRAEVATLRAAVTHPDLVRMAPRHACEWGTFSLVAATNGAVETLLGGFPSVSHVLLSSGACLPLRPAAALAAWLEARPGTDFIQSVACEDVGWAIGGLNEERFTLRFPFAWKRHRRLFDDYVELQRRVGFSRGVPAEVAPHLGSQWWCLTRETLTAILTAPERARIDRYFSRVWIPDESYYQSLARRHARTIVSRSLTFSRFDRHGRPFLLYDDHLAALRDRPEFLARKAWHGADALYATFVGPGAEAAPTVPGRQSVGPATASLDALFDAAEARQRHGRAGLYAQHRFPKRGYARDRTRGPYTVLIGYDSAFEGFGDWYRAQCDATGAIGHGRLFHPQQAAFATPGPTGPGGLPIRAGQRDRNPSAFLTSLIWTAAGRPQAFLMEIGDSASIVGFARSDPNARIAMLVGTWMLPLFSAGLPFERLRKTAARMQREETRLLQVLGDPLAPLAARLRVIGLADFLSEPAAALRAAFAPRGFAPAGPQPRPAGDLRGMVEALRNSGIELPSAELPSEDRPQATLQPMQAADGQR